MKVYERMIKFEYYWYVIRCWVPVESPAIETKSDFSLVTEYRDYLYDMKIANGTAFGIAQVLSDKFNLNACEVTNKETGMGALYYGDWP